MGPDWNFFFSITPGSHPRSAEFSYKENVAYPLYVNGRMGKKNQNTCLKNAGELMYHMGSKQILM